MPSTDLWDDASALALVALAVWLLSIGYGLLAERLVRVRLDDALLIPVGFCLSIIVSLGAFRLDVGNDVAVPVVLAPAFVGLVLARAQLRGRIRAGWPLLAGVGAFAFFNLSVIATGHWTFTGYNIENDSAYELVLISHLQAHGLQGVTGPPSTANTVVSQYLATGYPLGAQSLLAVLSGLFGVPAVIMWQGFISAMAGVGAVAAAQLSRRTMGVRVSALVGFVVVAAALTYQYALQGAIKEIAVVVGVLSALAVMSYAIHNLRGPSGPALAAIPLAALLAVFSAAGLPYALALAGSGVLGTLLVHRRMPSRAWLAPALSGAVVLAVLSVPTLPSFGTFLDVAKTGYSGSAPSAPSLGPLFRALPLSEISGVWLFGDYRLPIPPGSSAMLTAAATVVILLLLAPGVLRMLKRLEVGPLMGLLTMVLVLLIVYPRVTPYAQAKLLMIASPIVLLCAAQALSAVEGRDWRALAVMLGGALGGVVLASDAIAYHAFPVAPASRLQALAQIGQRLGARGPVLDTEFEQFAKYFAGPARLVDATDPPTPDSVALRAPGSQSGRSVDLDEVQLSFIESFPYVLTRRSPVASRPPANYSLMLENAYYELWRRDARSQVYSHVPLGGVLSAYGVPSCGTLRALVRGAPAGDRLAFARAPRTYGFVVAEAPDRSPGWEANSEMPGGVTTFTPGRAERTIVVARGGRFRLWVQGNMPRRVILTIDGRKVGSVLGNDTPGGWLSAGTVAVGAGRHRLGVLREGGNLAPGNGSTRASLGGVVLSEANEAQPVSAVAVGDWRSLCGEELDWVELLGPS